MCCSLPQVHRAILLCLLLSLSHTHTHSSCMSDPLPEIQCRVQRLSDSFLKSAPQVSHLSTSKHGPSSLLILTFTFIFTILSSFLFRRWALFPTSFQSCGYTSACLSTTSFWEPSFTMKRARMWTLDSCRHVPTGPSLLVSLSACVSLLQTMLEYEMLHKSLFALSVEIVLFSYNSQSRFVTYPLISLAHLFMNEHYRLACPPLK